jgi:hypothetical protein
VSEIVVLNPGGKYRYVRLEGDQARSSTTWEPIAVVGEETESSPCLFLGHAWKIHEVHLTDRRRMLIEVKRPFTCQCAKLFNINGRHIAQIQVVLNKVPYWMRPS